MSRRDALVLMLQSLLLALFPWMRTERGAEVVKAAVEEMVPTDPSWGGWAQHAQWHMVRAYDFKWRSDFQDRMPSYGRSA